MIRAPPHESLQRVSLQVLGQLRHTLDDDVDFSAVCKGLDAVPPLRRILGRPPDVDCRELQVTALIVSTSALPWGGKLGGRHAHLAPLPRGGRQCDWQTWRPRRVAARRRRTRVAPPRDSTCAGSACRTGAGRRRSARRLGGCCGGPSADRNSISPDAHWGNGEENRSHTMSTRRRSVPLLNVASKTGGSSCLTASRPGFVSGQAVYARANSRQHPFRLIGAARGALGHKDMNLTDRRAYARTGKFGAVCPATTARRPCRILSPRGACQVAVEEEHRKSARKLERRV